MGNHNKIIFVDTNILLNPKFNFNDYEKIYVSIITVQELDNLKRNERLGYQARTAIKNIEKANNVEIRLHSSFGGINFLENNNDNTILSSACDVYAYDKDCVFLTDEYALKVKADALELPCKMFEFDDRDIEVYKGYKEVTLDEYELSLHYQCPVNKWNLLDNEYLIIKDADGNVVDKQRWTDEKGFIPISHKTLKSVYFEDVKPRDTYQMLAIDSLNNSDFTLLFGVSGSAKTLLSLAWIMQNIQSGKIGKAVIVFNGVPLKNNKEQGFYPGSRNEKILQGTLGGILTSKFGDITVVEGLINQGKILLIPSSEIRGIEVSSNDVIYVTEAQNTDVYTMKTIIQRAKRKLIVEGDLLEQQDLRNNNHRDNGMLRAIEVFKGSKYFSCVKLKNRYRHPMGDLADKM